MDPHGCAVARLSQQSAYWLHLIIGPATRLPLTHVENCAELFAKAVADPRGDRQDIQRGGRAGRKNLDLRRRSLETIRGGRCPCARLRAGDPEGIRPSVAVNAENPKSAFVPLPSPLRRNPPRAKSQSPIPGFPHGAVALPLESKRRSGWVTASGQSNRFLNASLAGLSDRAHLSFRD
jgi:hypothetical protein